MDIQNQHTLLAHGSPNQPLLLVAAQFPVFQSRD
jgi:hypothetical protein